MGRPGVCKLDEEPDLLSGEGDCLAWGFQAFGSGQLARVVTPGAGGVAAAGPEICPAKPIIGWEPFIDYPSAMEHEELGLKYDYDHGRRLVTVSWAERGLRFEHVDASASEAIAKPAPGNKLGGWPNWAQGVEYPNCPRCGQRMEHVFQLDSEDHLPVMFGDVGCGHITQCPRHHDVAAFGWAGS